MRTRRLLQTFQQLLEGRRVEAPRLYGVRVGPGHAFRAGLLLQRLVAGEVESPVGCGRDELVEGRRPDHLERGDDDQHLARGRQRSVWNLLLLRIYGDVAGRAEDRGKAAP